ncbi:MAG: hypothetical protein ACREP2_01175 [Rhodanobacteraceae bacterium]
MPEARLMKFSDRGHTYAVRRFDRTPTSRRMYCSAMTRLDVIESEGHSYLDLVQVGSAAVNWRQWHARSTATESPLHPLHHLRQM